MARRARRRRKQKRPTRPSKRPRYLRILTGTAAAAVVATILIVLSQAPWERESVASPSEFLVPTPRPAAMPRQGTTLGSPDAPLAIVEYSDFQCPFCQKAGLEIVPQIEAEYIATGKAKLTFKHFPIEGQESPGAAEATECAAEQNAFWEYHDMLYLNRRGVDVGTFVPDNLKLFARELGLDTEQFNACLDEGKYRDKVVADYQEARLREVPGTPTFFVGQTKVVGAKPYSEFEKAIEDELAKLGETSATE